MLTGVSYDFHIMSISWASEASQWWRSMAIVVIFGLIIATMLTLIIVPNLFTLIEEEKQTCVMYIIEPVCFSQVHQNQRSLVTRQRRNNSHGLIWSMNTQANPTIKHENNSKTYWDFHINWFSLLVINLLTQAFSSNDPSPNKILSIQESPSISSSRSSCLRASSCCPGTL